MLFTRCPDCDTTFRVTDDALQKANGQVRCGRCASVFNAYAERRDGPGEAAPADEPASAPPARAVPATDRPVAASAAPSAAAPAVTTPPAAAPPAGAKGPALPSVKIPQTRGPTPHEIDRREVAPAPRSDEAFGTLSVADVVAQVESAAADDDADTGEMRALSVADGEAAGISPSEVQQVLESEPAERWPLEAPEPRVPARWWAVGSGVALAMLAAQSVHHYRADLVTNAAVGPIVQHTYAMLGSDIVPHWDIHQYEILDWVATAEPNTGGRGSLRITARIKNRGPQFQPYPSVHLRLKDRWETAVGSRVFAPTEYLAATPRELMAPGETTRAEIEVVDPGQDAYGFELDVCIEVETHVLSCGSDKVFL